MSEAVHHDRYLLTNAEIVTPDRVISGGTVAIETGLIAEVSERSYPSAPDVIDFRGRWLLPGLVDLHSDALEKEIAPRPGADFDPAFALAVHDRKLAAAGVTTQFHGTYFANKAGFGRSVEHGLEVSRAIHAYQHAPYRLIDHRVLYRLDLRAPHAVDGVLDVLDEDPTALISLNEHVPGQGQYRDLAAMRRSVRPGLGTSATEEDAAAEVDRRIRHAAETDDLAAETLSRIRAERQRRPIILASHDDDTSDRVDQMRDIGCTIAEFPVTLGAAERAHEVGMVIAAGAPNAVRGRSLSGNISALDLLSRGLVDLLVADYHAPSMLAAVLKIVDEGILDLPAAVRLVSATPAAAVGLTDRGAIEPGRRADLIAVERHGLIPLVTATISAGLWRYTTAFTPVAAFQPSAVAD